MKIGLVEMHPHDEPKKVSGAKAAVLDYDEGAHFIFAYGEEYQRALDELRAAGAMDRVSGEADYRAFNCLDLAPLTVARSQYLEMEQDLEMTRKATMRAESELQQTEAKLEAAIRRAEDAERALREANGHMTNAMPNSEPCPPFEGIAHEELTYQLARGTNEARRFDFEDNPEAFAQLADEDMAKIEWLKVYADTIDKAAEAVIRAWAPKKQSDLAWTTHTAYIRDATGRIFRCRVKLEKVIKYTFQSEEALEMKR